MEIDSTNQWGYTNTTMSKTISFISPKGGVGKTTVTILLANIFYFQFGWNIVVIDADYPQNSLAKRRKKELAEMAENPRLKKLYDMLYSGTVPYPIIATDIASCPNRIAEWTNKVDLILVDITGTLNNPDLYDLLLQINHFLIPARQDEFSLVSAVEFYVTILKNVRPDSSNFRDCHLFFNHVPFKNNLPAILADIPKQFKFLPQFIPQHSAYEHTYRTTLYPIPKHKKEVARVLDFAQQLYPLLEPVTVI